MVGIGDGKVRTASLKVLVAGEAQEDHRVWRQLKALWRHALVAHKSPFWSTSGTPSHTSDIFPGPKAFLGPNGE